MVSTPPPRPAVDSSHRRHHVLVILLAVTSGALDALGFLGLGGVFASVMTGNLVLLGLGAGTRHGTLAVHAVTAIAGYAQRVVDEFIVSFTRSREMPYWLPGIAPTNRRGASSRRLRF